MASRLVLDICGGQVGAVSEVVAQLPQREQLNMRVARAQKVIGVEIPADDMAQYLSRLQLDVSCRMDDQQGEILSV